MKNTHILVVEDDPCSSLMLSAWLRHLGAQVAEVSSITDADASLQTGSFDLILSDVHLPGNHRLQWIERVLQGDFPPPIMLLTGNPELESALRAANLPIAGYIVKPPDFTSLQHLLERLVSEHRRRVEFRTLSREAAWLLTAPEWNGVGADDLLRGKLVQLSQCLATEATRNPRAAVAHMGSVASWRSAINETIGVLEKTKHSFRSKELGHLRRRLEQLLNGSQAA